MIEAYALSHPNITEWTHLQVTYGTKITTAQRSVIEETRSCPNPNLNI